MEELIERSISAQGGREALSSLSSGIMESELTIYSSSGIVKVQRIAYINYSPFKMRLEDKTDSIKTVTVYDGNKGWMEQGGKIIEIPEEWISYFKNSEKRLNILLEYKKNNVKPELLGLKELNERSAYAVKFTDRNGEWMIFYFDEESFLPVKQEFNSLNPETGAISKSELFLENYTKILDIMTPMRIIVLKDGQKAMEVNFKNIQFNVPIEEDLFKIE
ncbi:MAG: hypothetical protein ACUVUG_06395 [Candidatus Aminicenantia bacterium]